jgi:hypothetical protein
MLQQEPQHEFVVCSGPKYGIEHRTGCCIVAEHSDADLVSLLDPLFWDFELAVLCGINITLQVLQLFVGGAGAQVGKQNYRH